MCRGPRLGGQAQEVGGRARAVGAKVGRAPALQHEQAVEQRERVRRRAVDGRHHGHALARQAARDAHHLRPAQHARAAQPGQGAARCGCRCTWRAFGGGVLTALDAPELGRNLVAATRVVHESHKRRRLLSP